MGKRDLLNRPFQSNGCQNKILRELSDLLAVSGDEIKRQVITRTSEPMDTPYITITVIETQYRTCSAVSYKLKTDLYKKLNLESLWS
jgi:hypothetical protein